MSVDVTRKCNAVDGMLVVLFHGASEFIFLRRLGYFMQWIVIV